MVFDRSCWDLGLHLEDLTGFPRSSMGSIFGPEQEESSIWEVRLWATRNQEAPFKGRTSPDPRLFE